VFVRLNEEDFFERMFRLMSGACHAIWVLSVTSYVRFSVGLTLRAYDSHYAVDGTYSGRTAAAAAFASR